MNKKVVSNSKPKRKGRPRKSNAVKKTKISLEEKQNIKLQKQREREKANAGKEPINKDRFYCTNKELQAELLKWRDSNLEEENARLSQGLPIKYEDRIVSEELGTMFLAIANKLLNHSSFRNYSKELKEDMRSFGLYKLIKGLKNYNFKFNNGFAYCTQALWNAYITVIGRHYKHQNMRHDLMIKLAQELATYHGINGSRGISKCIANYIGIDMEDN